MHKWKIVTVIILLLIVIYYFIYTKQTETLLKKSNIIELAKSNDNEALKVKIAKKIIPNDTDDPIKNNWLRGYDKSKDLTPRVDLITAFREFRAVKRCYPIIVNINQGISPYDGFLKHKNKNNKPEQWQELSLVQQHSFNLWVETCRSYMDDDKELYITVHERFRKRFYETKAKTKREKDFASSWEMREETRFINFKYDQLINGYDSENEKLTQIINKQIKYAKGMLNYININDDISFSLRSANEVAMYQRQLAELNSLLDGSLIVDENYLINLYQTYESNSKKVDVFLKQNISSEAFMTLAPLLLSNKHAELGFYDKSYYKSILQRVALLFACSMDYPCDSQSKEMIWECFLSMRLSNENACGINSQDYYLDHYFSLNQLTDVNQLLSYFFKNYAKN
jgi:hypothetical protein